MGLKGKTSGLSYFNPLQGKKIPELYKGIIAPTAATRGDEGDFYLDTVTDTYYFLVDATAGAFTWSTVVISDASTTVAGKIRIATVGEAAAGILTTVAVNPAALAALVLAGSVNWSEAVSGIGQLSTLAEAVAGADDDTAMTPLKVAGVLAAPPTIGSGTPGDGAFADLSSTGLATLGASATIVTGAVALSLGADAGTGAINCGTGAAARALTFGNITTTTSVAINSGTGHITLTSTGTGDIVLVGGDKITLDAAGTVDINSSAAAINIGDDDIDQAVNIATDGERALTIGSANGAASVDVVGGTGGINVAANAIAQTLTLGNSTGTSAIAMLVGTGHFTLDGVASSTYNIGASTTTGTIDIGGTAQTGTMTFGDSDGINIIGVGTGEGATTVNIATGATAAKVVHIADGAVANLVTIGSASGAAALTMYAGTGNYTLDGAATTTYTIGATTTSGTITIGGTAQTGTMTLGDSSGINIIGVGTGEGATTVNIATGATAAKVVHIADGAVANTVTIGTTNTTSTTTINSGSGGIVHVGKAIFTPDAITAVSGGGTAASLLTVVTEITTNGDVDLDVVTLANGVDGQIKIFAVVAVGNGGDSVKITPASMIGGTQITFSANPLGLGCQMYYDAGVAGWIVTGNNGGTVA